MNLAQVAVQETTSVLMTIFDSKQLYFGTGFLLKRVSKLAQAGFTVFKILVVLNEKIKHTHVFASLDTIQSMHRSGRMNSIGSIIRELLQIKSSLNMYDGNTCTERVRTWKHVINHLIDLLRTFRPYEMLALLHSDAADWSQLSLQENRNNLPDTEIWLAQIYPLLDALIEPRLVDFTGI